MKLLLCLDKGFLLKIADKEDWAEATIIYILYYRWLKPTAMK
jgi:hypothetical protein